MILHVECSVSNTLGDHFWNTIVVSVGLCIGMEYHGYYIWEQVQRYKVYKCQCKRFTDICMAELLLLGVYNFCEVHIL